MQIQRPYEPKWYFTFEPSGHYQIRVPNAPNAFYRLMQRLVLGIHWRRL